MNTKLMNRRTFIRRTTTSGIALTLVDLVATVQVAKADTSCGSNSYGTDPDEACAQLNPDENCGVYSTPDADQSCNNSNTDESCRRNQSGHDEDQSCTHLNQSDEGCGSTDQDNNCNSGGDSDQGCNGGSGASYDIDNSCGAANEQDQSCGGGGAGTYDEDSNCGSGGDQDQSCGDPDPMGNPDPDNT